MNWVLGTWPIAVPVLLTRSSSWNFTSLNDDTAKKILVMILALVQFLMSHIMHGNLGKCFCGLEVRAVDGKYMTLWQSLLRSAPYIAFVVMDVALPSPRGNAILRMVVIYIMQGVLLFLVINGLVVLFDRRHYSIMDLLARSEVVIIGSLPTTKYG